MTRKILNAYATLLTKMLFILLAVLCASVEAQPPPKIKLTLQDAPLIVLKDSAVTKKLNGIPSVAGTIDLKIKFHVLSFIPNTFHKVKVELLHGSQVLTTKDCYSVHSGKSPKCSITKAISSNEARDAGDYKLRVTNDNNDDIGGFNILKELTDVNPNVANIESTFERDCNVEYPRLTNDLSVSSNSTVETHLAVFNSGGEGVLRLRAKWHGLSLNPNFSSFYPLKVELLYDGRVVRSDEGYSIHSTEKGRTNKIDMTVNVSAEQNLPRWKLRITNSDGIDATGFDIEKGGDLNPFVPSFRSTFDPCR